MLTNMLSMMLPQYPLFLVLYQCKGYFPSNADSKFHFEKNILCHYEFNNTKWTTNIFQNNIFKSKNLKII